MCTNAYHHKCWLYNCVLKIWWSLSCTLLLSILNQLMPRAAPFLGFVYVFFSLHGSFNVHLWMQWWSVFTDNGFTRCVHAVIFAMKLSVFKAVLPEGLKITVIHCFFGFDHCTDRFNWNMNLFLILCDINPQILCDFTSRTVILKLLSYLSMRSFRVVNLTPSSLLKDSDCLWLSFMPNHNVDLLSINLISCEMLTTYFFPNRAQRKELTSVLLSLSQLFSSQFWN